MPAIQTSSASTAPPNPEALQRRRVLGRVAMSAAVAGVVAAHAFGGSRREDAAQLAGLVAERTRVLAVSGVAQ